jgi:hypothetical protein
MTTPPSAMTSMTAPEMAEGQQKVTVEHVHVHQGGQAIVGHFEHQGGQQKCLEAWTLFSRWRGDAKGNPSAAELGA